MTQASSAPAADLAISDEAEESNGSKSYAARSYTQWRLGLVSVGFSLLGLLPLKRISNWLSGGPMPDGSAFLTLACLLFFPLGIFFILNALRGLPRLTITPQGVALKNSFGTRWADWDSLEPFAIKAVHTSRFRKPLEMASARVIGPSAGGVLRRIKTFSVPDYFQEPIGTILNEINAARTRTVGETESLSNELAPSEASAIGLAAFTLPWLTFALSSALIVIFILEYAFAVTASVRSDPSIATLFALGALNREAVLSGGQWYRLFTAPLLHGGVAHIIGNVAALLMGGWILERLIGRLWFFTFFIIGALGGSLVSVAVLPSNIISVGASGALMGLFAALFVSSFRLTSGTSERSMMQVNSARILIPSLLPLFSTSSVHVDYGAHFGGALSGAAVAALLLKFWPDRLPQLRKAAAVISIVGAISFAASACVVIANYPKYRVAARPQLAAPSPKNTNATDYLSDHSPKRVACDGKWTDLYRNGPPKISYPDFLRDCITNNLR
jgi:membrane associated rhomboid family serine protease